MNSCSYSSSSSAPHTWVTSLSDLRCIRPQISNLVESSRPWAQAPPGLCLMKIQKSNNCLQHQPQNTKQEVSHPWPFQNALSLETLPISSSSSLPASATSSLPSPRDISSAAKYCVHHFHQRFCWYHLQGLQGFQLLYFDCSPWSFSIFEDLSLISRVLFDHYHLRNWNRWFLFPYSRRTYRCLSISLCSLLGSSYSLNFACWVSCFFGSCLESGIAGRRKELLGFVTPQLVVCSLLCWRVCLMEDGFGLLVEDAPQPSCPYPLERHWSWQRQKILS